MEIFIIYNQFVEMYAYLHGGEESLIKNLNPFGFGLMFALACFSVFFILQGIGIYMIAKNRNMKYKFWSFVPFANLCYLGKIVGTCYILGQKMTRTGLYTMIAKIIESLLCLSIIVSQFYFYIVHGNDLILVNGEYEFETVTTTMKFIQDYYLMYSEMFLYIVEFISTVLTFILVMSLYRKYAPEKYILFSWLTVFVPFLRYIFIFVLRNKKEVDYATFIRNRQEEYRQRYYSRYGNPNQNPNPYANNSQKQEPDDPFEEFSSKNDDDTDDFFN